MQEPLFRKYVLDAMNNPKPHFHPMFRFALHPIIFWPRTPLQPRRRCTHLMRVLQPPAPLKFSSRLDNRPRCSTHLQTRT